MLKSKGGKIDYLLDDDSSSSDEEYQPKYSDKPRKMTKAEMRKYVLHGAMKHLKGRGFDDATIRPIMSEVGKWLNPMNLVELMGGSVGGKGINDILGNLNPLEWGYKLGHDVIGPAIYKSMHGGQIGLARPLPPMLHYTGKAEPEFIGGKIGEDIHIDIGSHNAKRDNSMEGDGVKRRRGRPKKVITEEFSELKSLSKARNPALKQYMNVLNEKRDEEMKDKLHKLLTGKSVGGRFKKGTPEAKEWAKKMREARKK